MESTGIGRTEPAIAGVPQEILAGAVALVVEGHRKRRRLLQDNVGLHNPETEEDDLDGSPLYLKERSYKERNREGGYVSLERDYFASNCVYTDGEFARRFGVNREIFLKLEDSCSRIPSFCRSRDATGRPSITVRQKLAAALRVLVYGEAFDRVDEYMRMGATTVRDAFLTFTKHVVDIYEKDWLRKLSPDEAIETEKRFASRGMPGCIESIDCMKLEWKNCPTALAGQYKGRERKPTIVLEAMCDDRLVFNHGFFGMSGVNNDINVLNASPLLSEIIDGTWPPKVEYVVGGMCHNIPYVLADGIYPPWRVLIQTVPQAARASPADHAFSKLQEAIRKDIERPFGVLQSRFSWTKTSCRLWKEDDIGNAFKTCAILHNMMMEHAWKEKESTETGHINLEYQMSNVAALIPNSLDNLMTIQDEGAHLRLRNRLAHHILAL